MVQADTVSPGQAGRRAAAASSAFSHIKCCREGAPRQRTAQVRVYIGVGPPAVARIARGRAVTGASGALRAAVGAGPQSSTSAEPMPRRL